jgi:thiol-disulfide isomerase/thioredoxin
MSLAPGLAKKSRFWHSQAMTRHLVAMFLLAVTVLTARAELKFDTLRVGFTVYTNVTIIDANATDIYFRYSGGMINAKLRDLDPAVQSRFNYDPDVAADVERQRQDAAAHYVPNYTPSYASTASSANDTTGPEEAPRLVDAAGDNSPIDKPAPELTVEKWLTHKPVTADKFVLVFFWKSDSAPCRRAITDLNTLQKKYPDNLVVVGITTEPEKIVSQMTDPHIDFASGVDTTGAMLHAAGVNSVPTVLLIDPKGILRYSGHPAALKDDVLGKIIAPQ